MNFAYIGGAIPLYYVAMHLDTVQALVTHWPTDWIIVGALAILVALDALRAGSSRAASLAVALPLSAFAFGELSHTVPVASLMSQFSAPVAQSVLFGVIVAIFFFLIRRIVGLWGDSSEGPVQALITGVACAAVMTSVWLQIPSLDAVWHFGPQVQLVFGESFRLWWLAGATAALAYVRS